MSPKPRLYINPLLSQPNRADATGRQVCGKIKNKLPVTYLEVTYSREPTNEIAKHRAHISAHIPTHIPRAVWASAECEQLREQVHPPYPGHASTSLPLSLQSPGHPGLSTPHFTKNSSLNAFSPPKLLISFFNSHLLKKKKKLVYPNPQLLVLLQMIPNP